MSYCTCFWKTTWKGWGWWWWCCQTRRCNIIINDFSQNIFLDHSMLSVPPKNKFFLKKIFRFFTWTLVITFVFWQIWKYVSWEANFLFKGITVCFFTNLRYVDPGGGGEVFKRIAFVLLQVWSTNSRRLFQKKMFFFNEILVVGYVSRAGGGGNVWITKKSVIKIFKFLEIFHFAEEKVSMSSNHFVMSQEREKFPGTNV